MSVAITSVAARQTADFSKAVDADQDGYVTRDELKGAGRGSVGGVPYEA